MKHVDLLSAVDGGIDLWWRMIGKLNGFSYHADDIEWVSPTARPGPERIFHVRLAGEKAESRIDEIITAIKGGNLPNGILLTPLSTPANIVDLLSSKGMSIDNFCPCMALELNRFHAEPEHEHIKVLPVLNSKTLSLWADIVNKGLFGCELFSMDQYTDMFRLENTNMYLAYLDGVPASACMTIHENGIATLECVATLAEYRRKGLGKAVVSRALLEIKKYDVDAISLRSEPDGVNLYKSMGFQEVCRRIVASMGS